MEQKPLREAAPPRLSRGLVSIMSLYKAWHGAAVVSQQLGHRGDTQRHGNGHQVPVGPCSGSPTLDGVPMDGHILLHPP